MLVQLEEQSFNVEFSKICTPAKRGGISILIFVGFDVDAICACHILVSCLKSEFVKYNVVCVTCNEDLDVAFQEEIRDNKELRSIVMFNCGGNINLTQLFDLKEHPDLTVFVMDSHRPYHGDNIASKEVHLFDDGSGQLTADMDSEDEETIIGAFSDSEIDSYLSSEQDLAEGGSSGKHKVQPTFYGFTSGLTDQFIHHRIGEERYLADYEHFKTEVLNINLDPEEEIQNQYGTSQTGALLGETLHIYPAEEFKFFLYRYWSLYDSMYHSRYLAIRLEIWKSEGRKTLEELLARMGFPKHECQQSFRLMPKHLKNILKQKLDEHASKYNISDYTFPSFHLRQSGIFSAVDVVRAISVLMEKSAPMGTSDDSQDKENGGDVSSIRESNFWEAYSAIGPSHGSTHGLVKKKKIEMGIKFAIELQEVIVRQAVSIIQKREMVQTAFFRYLLLQDTADVRYFSNPLALTKLGQFLVDTYIDMGSGAKILPFVIGVSKDLENTYLMVGLPGTHSGSALPNRTGELFKKAAEATGTIVTSHFFDSSIVEVSKDDVLKFFDYLRSGV